NEFGRFFAMGGTIGAAPVRPRSPAVPEAGKKAVLSHQDAIDELLELLGALEEAVVARVPRLAAAEQLVGDVQGGEHGEAQRIACRRGVGRRAHLVVDVHREAGDILRIQRAADRIALSLNLDGNDASFVRHHISGGSKRPRPTLATGRAGPFGPANYRFNASS